MIRVPMSSPDLCAHQAGVATNNREQRCKRDAQGLDKVDGAEFHSICWEMSIGPQDRGLRVCNSSCFGAFRQ
jgi:hypothetical protein